MVEFLGIRHHGPGSCRNVVNRLQQIKPDLILLEGPPEANKSVLDVDLLAFKPPIAILAYLASNPSISVFFPFAEFSPEWQTILYAKSNSICLRFFDFPLSYSFSNPNFFFDSKNGLTSDPFDEFARISGYENGEVWWDNEIEYRKNTDNIFQAIIESVTILRQQFSKTSNRDVYREAWMRKQIKLAEKEGFNNIVVVCGAWHIPAIVDYKKSDDKLLLKNISKVKVDCSWVPWTNSRLSISSGYGAGILSPGWYEFLWNNPDDNGEGWLIKIANLLRDEKFDISSAHIIDCLNLANTLSTLRGKIRPGLTEFSDAVVSVFSFGDSTIMKLIDKELFVGDKIGFVPSNITKVPLIVDVENLFRKLRIKISDQERELVLDLRKSNDLEKSILFHQLRLLNVNIVKFKDSRSLGTFKEVWTLVYKPEFHLQLIDLSVWGSTLSEVCNSFVSNVVNNSSSILDIINILYDILASDMQQVGKISASRIDLLSSNSSDTLLLLDSIPNLIYTLRYGNVRKLDFSYISIVLNKFFIKIQHNIVFLSSNIDEDFANKILDSLSACLNSVVLSNIKQYVGFVAQIIRILHDSKSVHSLILGFAYRFLYDNKIIDFEQITSVMSYYTSANNDASNTALWFEGFLRKSGSILLVDKNLFSMLNAWVSGLSENQFIKNLPALRRTFSSFSSSERHHLGRLIVGDNDIYELNSSDFSSQVALNSIKTISKLLNI